MDGRSTQAVWPLARVVAANITDELGPVAHPLAELFWKPVQLARGGRASLGLIGEGDVHPGRLHNSSRRRRLWIARKRSLNCLTSLVVATWSTKPQPLARSSLVIWKHKEQKARSPS
jgi:hypothetical protein